MARAPNCSWGGPYVICSQLSPLVYRVKRKKETREVSLHVTHLKPYHPRETPPAHQLDKLAEFFSGNQISLPALDHPDEAQPRIESYVVDRVVGHKLRPGRKNLCYFEYGMHPRIRSQVLRRCCLLYTSPSPRD